MPLSEFEEGIKRWLLEMLEADEGTENDPKAQEAKDAGFREALRLLDEGGGYECAEVIFGEGVNSGGRLKSALLGFAATAEKRLGGAKKGAARREFIWNRYDEGIKNGEWENRSQAAEPIAKEILKDGRFAIPDDSKRENADPVKAVLNTLHRGRPKKLKGRDIKSWPIPKS